MIAGMSLMVAAVIHFASADIGLAELRLQEAKARALSRATALLIIRDNAMMDTTAKADQQEAVARDAGGSFEPAAVFKNSYQFMNGWITTGTIQKGNTLVSLNSSAADELDLLVRFAGASAPEVTAAFVEGVQAYRDKFPGFRYKEELLAINGSSRAIYDAIAPYVHPFRTGQVVWPNELAAQMMDAGLIEKQNATSDTKTNDQSSVVGRASGRITFASIAERRKQAAGDSETVYVDVAIRRDEVDKHTGARVWVSLNSKDPILRTEVVYY
jgi:hypothetical protein